jgi:F0F1-type ATP synthase assembly protein I
MFSRASGKRGSCVVKERRSRSPLAVGLEWASRVTTIGLGFALPPVLGYGLDLWLGSTPAATIIGAVLGFATGIMNTLKMAEQLSREARHLANQAREKQNLRKPPPTSV